MRTHLKEETFKVTSCYKESRTDEIIKLKVNNIYVGLKTYWFKLLGRVALQLV